MTSSWVDGAPWKKVLLRCFGSVTNCIVTNCNDKNCNITSCMYSVAREAPPGLNWFGFAGNLYIKGIISNKKIGNYK